MEPGDVFEVLPDQLVAQTRQLTTAAAEGLTDGAAVLISASKAWFGLLQRLQMDPARMICSMMEEGSAEYLLQGDAAASQGVQQRQQQLVARLVYPEGLDPAELLQQLEVSMTRAAGRLMQERTM